MTKLIRFVRFFKFLKKKNKILDYIHNIVKVDAAIEKLFFFIILFIICGHLLSCLWLMIAFYQYDRATDTWLEETWITSKGFETESNF